MSRSDKCFNPKMYKKWQFLKYQNVQEVTIFKISKCTRNDKCSNQYSFFLNSSFNGLKMSNPPLYYHSPKTSPYKQVDTTLFPLP